MPITEICTVIKVRKSSAIVELVRREECENCKACAFNKRNSIKMHARKETECKVGDKVIVEMPEKHIIGSYMILFAVPIVLILIAACITATFEWFIQLTAIAVALCVGTVVIVISDNLLKKNPKYVPTVKRRSEEKTNYIGETYD